MEALLEPFDVSRVNLFRTFLLAVVTGPISCYSVSLFLEYNADVVFTGD